MEWTIEFIDLLTVLTLLVEMEPEEAKLLEQILAGPIATKDDVATRGAKWPTSKKTETAPGLGGHGSRPTRLPG